ncbi:FAD:protein FMN transferase [Tropicibacter oceani]|uniref:FAD:protein FMN transferase n=1 Tax=Tropicibacter oceani TaxID=3058420 RepID=A0ABY8QEY1_9RHOB|nr:FAD:protein FMN transferase [Tropicibacter oceani]WGW02596.1 FAD:protein FMN transferase [Tropicibacter oceani]
MIPRRRFLAISAAAAMFPAPGRANPVYIWQGRALGAQATLRLAHPDAKAICTRVEAEISRLEDIFSLYRPDSALSLLNRSGVLDQPPFELLECLSLAGAVHKASQGRFDPTIQPLWSRYAESYARGTAPALADLQTARALTGWQGVTLDAARITLRPGMALTLNGIAQGFVADQVAGMLAQMGLSNILIDTGEFRALGAQPDGSPWPVRLAAGGAVPLVARALATSAPLGTTFDEAASAGHILDPRTAAPAQAAWREITVSASTAALADALSTAACLYDTRAGIEACLARFDGANLEAIAAL